MSGSRYVETFETTQSLDSLGWENKDGWYHYPFYLGENVRTNEINILESTSLILDVDHFGMIYQKFKATEIPLFDDKFTFPDTTILFCISSFNSWHFLSEAISFILYIISLKRDVRVALSGATPTRLKFMYELFKYLLPTCRIILLEHGTVYFFNKIITRRNTWFNGIVNCYDLNFEKKDKFLLAVNLAETKKTYIDDPKIMRDASREIYEDNWHRFNLSEKLIFVKNITDHSSTTPQRSLTITADAKTIAQDNGFYFVNISDFQIIEEYITRLYHAKTIIFSYGAAACTNRFFLNPMCKVFLIVNEPYLSEFYAWPDLGHLKFSHIFDVTTQAVLPDFSNEINAQNIYEIINFEELVL